jgi:hypothetical protein
LLHGKVLTTRTARSTLDGGWMSSGHDSAARRWPRHGSIGLGLMVVFWALNWGLDGLRTRWDFFPFEWLAIYFLLAGILGYRSEWNSVLPSTNWDPAT